MPSRFDRQARITRSSRICRHLCSLPIRSARAQVRPSSQRRSRWNMPRYKCRQEMSARQSEPFLTHCGQRRLRGQSTPRLTWTVMMRGNDLQRHGCAPYSLFRSRGRCRCRRWARGGSAVETAACDQEDALAATLFNCGNDRAGVLGVDRRGESKHSRAGMRAEWRSWAADHTGKLNCSLHMHQPNLRIA